MIRFAVLTLLLALPHTRQTNTEPTLPVEERIHLLKLSLKDQLKHIKTTDTVSLLPGEEYDYVDTKNARVTPVLSHDERAHEERYKLPQLNTKKPKLELGHVRTTTPDMFKAIELRNMLRLQKDNDEKYLFEKPVETFYRKVYRRQLDEEVKSTPLAWVHCQDVITPLLTGAKRELGAPYKIDENHRIVQRLIQLLKTNVTEYTQEEAQHIVYQVSELDIRLYQWTAEAIRKLFEVIIKGQKHTFRRLIYGLRKLFKTWHLDYDNVTVVLKETRIFRPVCIHDDGDQSSTKTSGGPRFTRPRPSTPSSDIEDCNDR